MATATAKSSPEGAHEGKQARRQRQPRAAKKGNHAGRQKETRQQRQSTPTQKGNQEDRQEQTRREIGKGEQLGDKATVAAKSSPEGKSRRENSWETKQQRQPRADQKGNHEGRPAGRQSNSGSQEQTRREMGSPEGKSGRENSWETKQQRQPRAAQKGNHEGRQGGSDFLTIRRFRKSGTQPLRSKNPYSFQLSGE